MVISLVMTGRRMEEQVKSSNLDCEIVAISPFFLTSQQSDQVCVWRYFWFNHLLPDTIALKAKSFLTETSLREDFFCCWSAIIWTLLLLHSYYNTWPVHSASTKNKSILIELPPFHFFVLTTPTNQRRYLICLKHQNNNLPAVKISVPILFKGLSAKINREPLK